MPAPEARDQTIVAQLLTELAKIGTAGPIAWLTSPTAPSEGSPGDAIAEAPLQFFLDHEGTDESDAESGGIGLHSRTLNAKVWIFARMTPNDTSGGMKLVRELAADCVRVLQAAEGTFQTLSGAAGLVMHGFTTYRDMQKSGFAAGSIALSVQYSQTHDSP